MQQAGRVLLGLFLVASVNGVAVAQDAPASPSLDPSSAGVPVGLEAAFPTRLLGEPLDVIAYGGDELIAGAEAGDAVLELVDLAAEHDVGIADFGIVSSSIRRDGPFVGLLAAGFSGVPAIDVVDALMRLILELDEEVELTTDVVAGREVTRVGPGSGLTGDSDVTVLTSGDITWFVVASDEDLEEIVATLP